MSESHRSNDEVDLQQIATIIRDASPTKPVNPDSLILLRNVYVDLFHRWRTGQLLDSISSDVFNQLANLWADVCLTANDIDAERLKTFLIDDSLMNELLPCLNEIADQGKYLHDEQIRSVDGVLRAIHYLSKGRVEIQSLPLMSNLLDHVVRCVCSKTFIDIFQQINQFETLNIGQTFLLDTCPTYISWQDAGRYKETTVAVRTALLSIFVCWFEPFVVSYQTLTKLTIKIFGQLCIPLIGGNANDEEVFSSEIRDDYCKMIDQIYTLLTSIIDLPNLDDLAISLTKVLAQNLYSLTMTNDLRNYIKSKQMVPLLLKLTNIDEETIQFHVYRILAAILTEEDIKTLINPSKTTNVFLRFLINLIDDSSMIPRFQNLLRSLKILIQHDQIKDELTKQDALPLLLRCATESKFDPIKVRLAALEILLALTFNDEAAQQLKKNESFINHLKGLVDPSNDQRLQRVAENLLWKLEKEENAVTTADPSSNLYHIMLSYSHSDKDLCYRLHDRLIKDQFRVWIDRDQMHGQTMVAMANAIENSEFVFICMSETYKQSAYCQSEAHYAFERRCHLIPLIMKPHYRPDGWLGILVSGKIYVDFPKLGFDLGYEKLKNEISRYQNQLATSNAIIAPLQQSIALSLAVKKLGNSMIAESSSTTEPILIKDYPHCILDWTNEHVRAFLFNENLESLLPVIGNMNGRLLFETYKRCKAHWELMFQTFKSEVISDGTQKPLTIDTYIRFLDEIQKYVPLTVTEMNSSPASVLCLLM